MLHFYDYCRKAAENWAHEAARSNHKNVACASTWTFFMIIGIEVRDQGALATGEALVL